MLRIMLATAVLAVICGAGWLAWADDGGSASKKPCCPPQCPNCKAYCKFEWDKEAEEKHCWCVECKPICIPKITFPWQDCCAPKCARVKWVKRLKKMEYECEHCKCKWTVVEVPCGDCEGRPSYPCANGDER